MIPDRIVAGTFMIAAAATGGKLSWKMLFQDIWSVTSKLREMGVQIREENERILIKAPERLRAVEFVRTLPYPGYPTDLQTIMAALTIARDQYGGRKCL